MQGWTLADLDAGLNGSPYSLPRDAESRERIAPLLERVAAVETAAAAAKAVAVQNTLHLLRRSQRVREIYESNKIEGLGPSLARTNELLLSPEAQDIAKVINRCALTRSLASDPKVHDVLGLHGAKLLAEEIVRNDASARPLTEADLRGMHELIMGEDAAAGRYKRYTNEISGSGHSPLLPSDVPAAMGTLSLWVQQKRQDVTLPPVVTAAAAHAWLTHIHPYEDGNGRVTRLLANIITGSAALPPLIVKSTVDRGKYIQALGHSDEGGDLALLISVFLRVVNRALRDMQDPKWAL